jgi:hypothetical protein
MSLLEHTLAALAIQGLFRFLTGNWWSGAVAASAYFLGREVAQAEYRWIEVYGHGLRANMPWWAPMDLRVWPKLDQWVDWMGPIAATSAVACLLNRRR